MEEHSAGLLVAARPAQGSLEHGGASTQTATLSADPSRTGEESVDGGVAVTPVSSPEPEAVSSGSDAPLGGVAEDQVATPHRRSRRKLYLGIAVVIVLLAGASASAWWFMVRETDEDRYLAALTRGGFEAQYATPDVALATGQAFCTSLAGGAEPEGFDYQEVAVTELCPQFAESFKVIPTPEQQAEKYTGLLRDKGLGGMFSSDAAAVTHAQAICRALDEGSAQQGPEVDAVGVSVYCAQYESGFKTLFPIKVSGTFTLFDLDPSVYYPSIDGPDSDCSGTGGYSDISQGREVRVKNSSGDVLTTTNLRHGEGTPPYMCEFPFKFTVMDGEKGGYMIEVGDRGSIHYSAADLKLPKGVEITLGD